MRALVATGNAANPAEVRAVDPPSPAPDEAIVEVRAFGLNRGELRLLASRPAGWRPGQDIAGVVVQAAGDGTGPHVGTRVIALVDQAGWAEQAAAPVARLAALPDEVGFAAAAALPVAGLTALRALRLGGSLLGRRVLITGAAGGVGRIAIQLAAGAGARVTGVVSSAERGAGLRELGAGEVITTLDGLRDPFHLILESAGGASLAAAIRLVAADGTVVMFGNSSGEQASFNFADFAGHPRARLYAFFVYASADGETFGQDLGLLAALVGQGQLDPQVGLEASWRDLGQGLAALRDRRVAGKAVFSVD